MWFLQTVRPQNPSLQLHEWVKGNIMRVCAGKFRARPQCSINHFNLYFTWQSEYQKIKNQSEDSNCITPCMGAGKHVLRNKRGHDIGEHELSLIEIQIESLKGTHRGLGIRNSETGSKLAM